MGAYGDELRKEFSLGYEEGYEDAKSRKFEKKASGVTGDQDTVDDTLEILEDVATGQIGVEEALSTLLGYFGAN